MSVANVHHLGQSLTVNSLEAILEDWDMSRRVCFFELCRLVLALEHVDLNVFVVEAGDMAVEQEGATVRVQAKANDIDLVCIDTSD